MKYFVVIAAVLAALAVTQAHDETNLVDSLEPNPSSPVLPSDPIPPKPGRPGRPGRRPQPNEPSNQQFDNENPPQHFPHIQPVLLNFDVDFGEHNNISDNQKKSKTAPAPAK